MHLSRLKANFRHPSVAFKGSDVANSPTCHSESNIGTAGVAVKPRVNIESSLCLGISLMVIYVYSTCGVF